jgi:hypothetical protein
MSLFRNAASYEPMPPESGMSRLLLACRFNFRQKTWSLPLFSDPQDAEYKLRLFAQNFPQTLFSGAIHFSDPSMGGATPSKPLLSRSESGQPGFWENSNNQPKEKMKLNKINPSMIALTAAWLSVTAVPAMADVVTDWNLITVNATKVAPALNSNLASRIDAIEAIAVYDAVNSIQQYGTPYSYYNTNAGPSSAQAAAAQAAHDVLVNYFPGQQAALDADLTNSLDNITDGPIGNGQAVGSASAAAIIALRANDGSSPNVSYNGPTNIVPGAYQLTPNSPTVSSNFTFAAGINEQWGTVAPFVLTNGSQFRPPPPPTTRPISWR